MKIVCDSCSAKYSIADEKVAGKVFKIRCKKCSEVIVVRGDQLDQPEQQEEATALYDYGDESPEAVWHVVVNGDQQGPFAPVQLGEMLTAGTIDWEVYVWREGFDNWLAARDVPELVEAITGQPQEGAAPAAAAAAPADMGGDPFAGGGGMGGDIGADMGGGQAQDGLFAAAADPGFGGGGDDAFAAGGGAGGGADLFAQADAGASPFEGGGDDDVVASSPGPRVSQEQAMTGQRNENSVLFSLQNLQALATGGPGGGGSPAPSMSSASSSSGSAKPGHASGEGSGLIDIRALASATGVAGGGGGAAAPAGGSSGGGNENVDDLLSIGTGSPLSSGLGAPVLAPVVEEKNNKGLIIAISAVGGVVALAAAAVIIVLVTAEPEPVAMAGSSTGTGAIAAGEGTATGDTPATTTESGTAAGGSEAAANTGSDDQGTSDESSDEGEDSADEGSSGSSSGSSHRSRRRRSSGGSSSSSSGSSNPDPTPAAAPATMSSGGGGDIDDLLNAALGGGGMMAAPMQAESSGGGGNLPDSPPRDGVLRALRSVQGAVGRCGNGQHGVANTTITVSGSNGRVSNARVTGQFAGTPIGSCVARAVRGAQFPRFRRPTFQVSFPYRI